MRSAATAANAPAAASGSTMPAAPVPSGDVDDDVPPLPRLRKGKGSMYATLFVGLDGVARVAL